MGGLQFFHHFLNWSENIFQIGGGNICQICGNFFAYWWENIFTDWWENIFQFGGKNIFSNWWKKIDELVKTIFPPQHQLGFGRPSAWHTGAPDKKSEMLNIYMNVLYIKHIYENLNIFFVDSAQPSAWHPGAPDKKVSA